MANLEPLGLLSSEDPIENIKTVLDNYDHIGIWLSGGADSALGLYLLQMYNTNTTILPLHGMDIRRWKDGQTKLSEGATEDIIKVIRKRQPEKSHLLHDMYCFDYEKEDWETKAKYHQPVEDGLRADGTIQVALNFVTKNPPIKLHDQQEPRRDNKKAKVRRPFARRDKKWVASLYEEYDLMEDLFPLTVSCISPWDEPCKQCFWCKEKKWAFGMYDGGIKNDRITKIYKRRVV